MIVQRVTIPPPGPTPMSDLSCRGYDLDPAAFPSLAAALGESLETVMSVHRLRRALARAWVIGDPTRPDAAIVQGTLLPEEPHAFGEDPAAILALLREVPGWQCVNAPEALAPALADLIARETGASCILGPEIYLVQDAPPPGRHPVARRLLLADLPLLDAAAGPLNMHGWRFGSAARLLEYGIAAGVVEDGRLAAAAFTSALGERFAEVGIVTRPDARGRGHATGCAAIVCDMLHRRGVTPVWSVAADNHASLRVAARLGFRETSRRIYLCRG
jgi:GNAT superfamily N-acetyltransferase